MEELKYQYERLRSEYFQSIVRNERIKRNFKEIKRNYNETPVEITDKQINIKLCNIKNLNIKIEINENKYDIEDIRIFNAMDELKEKHKNDSIDIKKFFLLFSHLLRMAYDYEFDDIFEILFFQKTDITMSIRHSTEENIFKKYLFK